MTLNAEVATMTSIEHKIHRVHYQTHHYHVHHLLTPQYHQLHNNTTSNSLQDFSKLQHLNTTMTLPHQSTTNQQDQILPIQELQKNILDHPTITDLSLINNNNNNINLHHNHPHHHLKSQNQHNHHHNHPEPSTVTKKITTSRCLNAAQIQRDQQLSLVRSRRQAAAKLRQKSQIQFIMFAAFAYILSPIDLIPEVVFGVFGILDDLLFLFMCLFCIAIIIIYPIFREMRRTIFEKFGLKRVPTPTTTTTTSSSSTITTTTTHHLPMVANKSF